MKSYCNGLRDIFLQAFTKYQKCRKATLPRSFLKIFTPFSRLETFTFGCLLSNLNIIYISDISFSVITAVIKFFFWRVHGPQKIFKIGNLASVLYLIRLRAKKWSSHTNWKTHCSRSEHVHVCPRSCCRHDFSQSSFSELVWWMICVEWHWLNSRTVHIKF